MKKTAVIIEDSEYMGKFIKTVLEGFGMEVVGISDRGRAGIEMALEFEPDLITVDNILPDMLGVDIAKVLLVDEKIKSKVLMISALRQTAVINSCMEYGVSDYILKPFKEQDLREKLVKLFPR